MQIKLFVINWLKTKRAFFTKDKNLIFKLDYKLTLYLLFLLKLLYIRIGIGF